MDGGILTAILGLTAAVISGTFLIYRDKRSYQAEFVDDVIADRKATREEHLKCQEENRRLRQEADDAISAASHALVRLGTVEAYAFELEDRLGIPHREWIDQMDTQPQHEQRRD